ncbi:MAG: nuclear transport factor 2 family protein [Planctomycetota bacterium]|nr:nuclear transport factor 2 family protein [Planctomycetota bacterium]
MSCVKTVAGALMLAVAACWPAGCSSGGNVDPGRDHAVLSPVDAVLNELHDAASRADGERYFALFTPDAIFYGTDDSERWTVDQFRDYARPYFEKGQGWTYRRVDRQIFFSEDRRTAWFDERLDNDKWGRARGTGVLVRTSSGWKIAQYNLTVPVPNDLLPEVAQRIREHGGR